MQGFHMEGQGRIDILWAEEHRCGYHGQTDRLAAFMGVAFFQKWKRNGTYGFFSTRGADVRHAWT
jgi:hypothetical protein